MILDRDMEITCYERAKLRSLLPEFLLGDSPSGNSLFLDILPNNLTVIAG
jgi:hypothetical protein